MRSLLLSLLLERLNRATGVRGPVSLPLLSQRRPSLVCSNVLRSLAVRPSQVTTRRISLPSVNSIRSSGGRGIIGPPMTDHTCVRDCRNRIVLIRADAADLPIFAHETTASRSYELPPASRRRPQPLLTTLASRDDGPAATWLRAPRFVPRAWRQPGPSLPALAAIRPLHLLPLPFPLRLPSSACEERQRAVRGAEATRSGAYELAKAP